MKDLAERIRDIEKAALTGDRLAVLALVGAFRRVREASKEMLADRYRDGECDAVALSTFEMLVEQALKEAAPADDIDEGEGY